MQKKNYVSLTGKSSVGQSSSQNTSNSIDKKPHFMCRINMHGQRVLVQGSFAEVMAVIRFALTEQKLQRMCA